MLPVSGDGDCYKHNSGRKVKPHCSHNHANPGSWDCRIKKLQVTDSAALIHWCCTHTHTHRKERYCRRDEQTQEHTRWALESNHLNATPLCWQNSLYSYLQASIIGLCSP